MNSCQLQVKLASNEAKDEIRHKVHAIFSSFFVNRQLAGRGKGEEQKGKYSGK